MWHLDSVLSTLAITDNGDGIVYEEIEDTFGAFLTSRKNLLSLNMKSKANKGKGRFSFSVFASSAKWITVYKSGDVFKTYEIVLENDKKEVTNCTEPVISDSNMTGTRVEFYYIFMLTSEKKSLRGFYICIKAEILRLILMVILLIIKNTLILI